MIVIPAWPTSCVDAKGCYDGCVHLNGAWTTDESALMPSTIVSHEWCVKDCGKELRALFFIDWGGTKKRVYDDDVYGVLLDKINICIEDYGATGSIDMLTGESDGSDVIAAVNGLYDFRGIAHEDLTTGSTVDELVQDVNDLPK